MSDTKVSSGGVGFGGLLTVLFVGLKLTGFIAWSWWWVLCPLWIPLAIILAVLISVFGVALIAASVGK